jgi:hypothetical protein
VLSAPPFCFSALCAFYRANFRVIRPTCRGARSRSSSLSLRCLYISRPGTEKSEGLCCLVVFLRKLPHISIWIDQRPFELLFELTRVVVMISDDADEFDDSFLEIGTDPRCGWAKEAGEEAAQ